MLGERTWILSLVTYRFEREILWINLLHESNVHGQSHVLHTLQNEEAYCRPSNRSFFVRPRIQWRQLEWIPTKQTPWTPCMWEAVASSSQDVRLACIGPGCIDYVQAGQQRRTLTFRPIAQSAANSYDYSHEVTCCKTFVKVFIVDRVHSGSKVGFRKDPLIKLACLHWFDKEKIT